MKTIKNYLKKTLSLIALAIFFVGCKTISSIQIEVLQPANITLPSETNRVLLLNNWSTSNHNDFKNPLQKTLFQLDTLTSQNIIAYLASYLNESPRLDTSIKIDLMFYRQAKDLFQPMAWEDALLLGKLNKTEIILSLEGFSILDSIVRIPYFDGYSYSTYTKLKLVINTLWRIYYTEQEQVFLKWWQHDTLYVNEIEQAKQYYELIESLQGRNWLGEQIAMQVASKTADKIVPLWKTVDRVLFSTLNTEMQQALSLAYSNKWLQAATIWQKYGESQNATLASAASHNMAVVCEVQGKLDLALIWAEKSMNYQFSDITYAYIKQLKLRFEQEAILNKQFGQ